MPKWLISYLAGLAVGCLLIWFVLAPAFLGD